MTQTTAPGRVGITFDQVAAVADAFEQRGERPTLRSVRAELGTGSMGTVQKHLNAWQGQRRQIVATTAILPAEIQRVILSEIEREIGAARTELEADLAAVKGDRDALADDNEAQAGELEQQSAQLDALEATTQQQTGRIAQMGADLASTAEAVERERGVAEQARQSLAKAELRLEAMPRLETELERVRAALETSAARAVAGEQLAAVTAAKLAGVETRLAESGEREKTLASRLAAADAAAREQSAALLAMSDARHRAEGEASSLQAQVKAVTTKAENADKTAAAQAVRAVEAEKALAVEVSRVASAHEALATATARTASAEKMAADAIARATNVERAPASGAHEESKKNAT
jgi:chromosome segregation ATPase